MTNQRWQVWLASLIGLWVFLSPWVLANLESTVAAPLNDAAKWNLYVGGGAILILSVVAVVSFRSWLAWLTAIVGVWLAASAWILSFDDATAVLWSTVAAGGAVAILAAWAALIGARA
jgi:hypothetical protein